MNQFVSITDDIGVQGSADAIDQPRKFARFEEAMCLASNAFFNIEQLLLILRGDIDGCKTIDQKRVVSLIQIGIDLTHMQGELLGQEAEAFEEANRG
ncbi:hypothetical protein [Paraburkholderia sp. RL17-337-BIB-A]|uniref:hypothetical protein n=1 Tax=Paraburkholderia sp. RL17-337-BIB-A TaxID=3031636 RepID=UPI0038B8C505